MGWDVFFIIRDQSPFRRTEISRVTALPTPLPVLIFFTPCLTYPRTRARLHTGASSCTAARVEKKGAVPRPRALPVPLLLRGGGEVLAGCGYSHGRALRVEFHSDARLRWRGWRWRPQDGRLRRLAAESPTLEVKVQKQHGDCLRHRRWHREQQCSFPTAGPSA